MTWDPLDLSTLLVLSQDQKCLKYLVLSKKWSVGPNITDIFGPPGPKTTRTKYFVTGILTNTENLFLVVLEIQESSYLSADFFIFYFINYVRFF